MRNSRPLVSKKSQPVRTFSRLKLYAAVLAASQWMVTGPVWAAPEGGEVVGGEGIIQQAGVETIINQATERMAIDWRSFDVAANERVEFIQPSSSSVALNRVLSNRGSEILGRIDANGQVMLVNANGVVFGKDSVVNVGGMIASGLNIDPTSFINGDFALNSIEGAEGKVINYGIINAATGGSVTLVGEQVQNDGLISAKLGAVNLVAGKAAVLTFDPTGMVGVKVTEAVVQDELGVDAAVINNGSINAEGGRVLLSASVSEDVFSDAVNNAGMNKSTSVVMHDDGSFTLGAGADVINTGNISTSVNQGNAGQVVLLGDNVTHSGSITASTSSGTGGSVELHSTDTTLLTENSKISAQASAQGEGGDIKVLGNKVGLFDQAEVNASGVNGGGQVLIGGDKTGQNKQIRNADFIYLGEDTKVKTDALVNGNGGKLITFASDTARIYGNLYSRGGSEGGNGGFIETSGLKGFEILNAPDFTAPVGIGGTWLIDPYNLTIDDSDSSPNLGGSGSQATPFSPGNSSVIMDVEELADVLVNGSTVYIATTSAGGTAGQGTITLDADLIYNNNPDGPNNTNANAISTLVLNAANNIVINGNITRDGNGTGNLSLVLNANNGTEKSGSGSVIINSGKKIETQGGKFTANGVNFTTGFGNQNDAQTAILTNGGDVELDFTGSVTLESRVDTNGGKFTVLNSGSFNSHFNNGEIKTYGELGGGDILINSAGNVDLGYVDFGYNWLNANFGGTNPNKAALLRVGSITINSGGDVIVHKDINFNNTGKRTNAGGKGYSGNLLDGDDSFIKIDAFGDIETRGLISDIDYADARDALNIELTAGKNNSSGGDILIGADIYTAGGNFTAKSTNFTSTGRIINTDRANAHASNITASANGNGLVNGNALWSNGGNVTISASDNITLGNITTDGSCTLPSSIACTGNLSLSGIDTDTVLAGMQSSVVITQTGVLNVAGDTTFNTGTGTITLENIANNFTKDLIFTSAGNTSITDSSAIRLGTSSITGNLKLTTGKGAAETSGSITQIGAVTVTGDTEFNAIASVNNYVVDLSLLTNDFGGKVKATKASGLKLADTNDLSLDAITLVAGAAAANGIIDVTAGTTNKIILNGNLNSSAATTKNIVFHGNVEVASNTTINAGTGAISFTGTTNSNDATAKNLTLTGGTINFTGNVGNLQRLGDFKINSTGVVTFADVTAKSFDVSTNNNFTAQNINTSGANSTLAAGGVGGDIVINAGSISLASVNASGGNSTAPGNNAGGSAGDITLTANNSAVSKTITISGDVSAEGGTGSGAGASGAVGEVTLTLANNTFAGQVNLNSSSFLSSSLTINGSANSTDTLTLTNSKNDWSITAANTGTVKDTDNLANSPVISFSGFENITGGTGADNFVIEAAGSVASINGGTGVNTLTGRDVNNTWDIKGSNQGDLKEGTTTYVQFTDIHHLVGGSLNDAFEFSNPTTSAITGSIKGGMGEGAGVLNSIKGRNAASTWVIANLDAGSITGYLASFENIHNLTGGSAADTFNFSAANAAISGKVDGGATTENNAIIARTGAPNTWLMNSNESGKLAVTADLPTNYVSDFDHIQVFTGAGTDTMNFENFSTGEIKVTIGATGSTGVVSFVGKDNVDAEIIKTDGTNVWTITATNKGTVNGISFDKFNKLTGGTGKDTFDFSTVANSVITGVIDGGGLPADNEIIARAGTGVTNTWSMIDNNSGSLEQTAGVVQTYINRFNDIQIFTGAGSDKISYAGINSGTVEVTLGAAGVTGVTEFVGSVSVDSRLIGGNTNTDWIIDGVNSGRINAGNGEITFSDFNYLSGGDQRDTFIFFDTGSIASGSGGGGNDIVDLSNLTITDTIIFTGTTVKNISSVHRVIGSATLNHTLQVTAGTNTWRIFDVDNDAASTTISDGVNDGYINNGTDTLQFVNFSNLQGGTGVDTFDIETNFTGVIRGGDNNDIFNIHAVATNLQGDAGDDQFVFFDSGSITTAAGGTGNDIVDISNLTSDQLITFSGATVKGVTSVSRVIGSASHNHTLQAGSGANNWRIFDFDNDSASSIVSNGVNDGHVVTGGTTLQFANFNNLQGGSGADIFEIETNFTGSIKGGNGSDTFNIKAAVGNLDGEIGDDRFVFFDNGSIVNATGGDGNDIVDLSNLTTAQTITFSGSTVKGVSSIYRVIGSTLQNHTLQASSGTNTWRLFDIDNDATSTVISDGINDGQINDGTDTLQFVNFNNLQGGSGVDTFEIETNFTGLIRGGVNNDIFNIKAVAGNIEGDGGDDQFVFFDGGSVTTGAGGTGSDVVDLSNLTTAQTITFTGTTVKNISSIFRVIGSATQTHTLEATSGTNTWRIYDVDNDALSTAVSDGINDGQITNGNGTLQFVNFSNLHGGVDVDTFEIETDFTGAIKGGGNNDIFNIKAVAANIDGEIGDDRFVFFDNGSIGTAAGGDGDDIVDLSNLTSAQTITFSGNTVKGVSSVLRVIGNASQAHTLQAVSGNNIWRIFDFDNNSGSSTVSDGINDGSIDNGSATLQFVNFSNLQGGTGIDRFEIETNFTGSIKGGIGNDIFNIRATVGNIDGEAGNDSFAFYNTGSAATATGGDGDDIVDLSNLTSAQTITFSGSTVKGVSSVYRVVGNASQNHTLQASSGTNTWRLFDIDGDATSAVVSDGINDGLINDGTDTLQFVNFSNLQGGSGVDTFEIETNFTGSIKGGGDNDIFNIKAVAGNIQGEAGDDQFVFFDSGSITTAVGGLGNNIVDLSNLTSAQTITFTGTTVKDVSNVYRVIGNASKNHTLQATSGTNTWRIFDVDNDALSTTISDGVNDGHITNSIGTMQFVNFSNLQGGGGVDTFEIETNFTGSIKGGGDNDIFNIRAVAGNIDGEAGADQFVFFDNGSVTTATGGADNDVVDLSQLTSQQTIILNGTTVKGVSSVFRIIGSSTLNHTLQATSGSNSWAIYDFDGAGNLADGINDGTVAGIEFVGFSTLRGGSDDDTFTIGQSGSINTIDGGLGTNILIGRNSSNIWNVTGENSGIVTTTSGNTYVSTFNRIQNLTGGSGDDQFAFNSLDNAGSIAVIIGGNGANEIIGRDSTNTWSISAADSGSVSVTAGPAYIASFTEIQTLVGGNLADVFDINANVTNSIRAGNGNNIFNINTTVGNLQGGNDNDQFVFGLNGRANSVNGGDGTNSLNARNANNTWTIISSNAGNIANASNDFYVGNFSNIQLLNGGNAADVFNINAAAANIYGNDGNDAFVFNLTNNGSVNFIDGGSGTNSLRGRNQDTTWTLSGANSGSVSTNANTYVTSFTSISNLLGGSAIDTLAAVNQSNTWIINSTNEGELYLTATPAPADKILFTGIENLLGNQGIDLFTFTANGNITGLIDGGTSATQDTIKDALNLSAVTGNLTVRLGSAQAAANVVNVVNVEDITASASNQDNHVLIGASDVAYRWKITAQNQGYIERAVDPTLETSTNFFNFGDLRGGTNSDRFDVQGTITKSIDGGSGIDLVDYSQRKENFVIVLGGSGGLGNTGINGIEGVVGNSASGNGFTSTIQVNSGDNIWEIGASSSFGDGNNDGSITINNNKVSFENFTNLIGGSGADTFRYIENGQWIGNIEGGSGNNIIDASLSTKDQQFVVNGTALNAGTNLKGIDRLIANTNTNSSLISTLQSNIWQIDNQGNGRLNSNLDFINIANLQGGSFADTFSFANISWLKGTVDGGGGTDTVNLTAMDKAIQVAVDAQTDADINLLNIETINANNNFSNTLKGDLNGNEWHINASNAGVLNKKINFTGFANLTGSALVDMVVFDNSAATLTGHLNLGDGQDTLDLSASDRDITVQLNSSKTTLASGVLSVDKIEIIKGDVDQSNRLIGDNFANTWTLDDVNAGRVTAAETGTITFTQFKNITGGSQDDLFVFEALGGLTGLVDGGGQAIRDNVDLSKSNNANVVITTTGESIGFTNIEKYVGNNVDSTLTAANIINNWSLTGANRGTLNEAIEFENFGVLKGGNKQDNFVISNATISGNIDSGDGDDTFDIRASAIAGKIMAGAGDDRFMFNIAPGAEGTADIDGGEGANRLTIEGGDTDYKVSHQLGRHEYVSAAGNTYSILYSNVSNVFDNVLAKSLSIFGTTTADTFRLLGGRYNINNVSTVNYTNKSNLIVNGTADDQVIVDGTVGIESTVTFNNLRLLAENAGKIQAQSLELVNTGSVGSATARLNTAINDLSLSATNGAVYLDEQDALVFKNFNVSTTELVDIKAGGNLTASGALTYSGNLNLESARGNIDLGNNNSLSGTVSLKAAGNISLDNLQTLALGDLVAQNVTLGSSTSIKGLGVFSVAGLATLNAGSEISLINASNDINQIAVARATKLDVFDNNGFTTVGLNVANDVSLHSSGGIILSTSCTADCNNTYGISAKNLKVQSDAGVTIAKSIAATDSINIESQGLVINDAITSKQFTLNALNGKLFLNESGNLLGQEGTGIELTANNIEQRSKIISGGNVKVSALGDVTMTDAAVMESLNGDVVLNGNNLQLATINAAKGSTTITAQNITANKSITSKKISLNAGNGKIVLNTDGNLLGQEGTGIDLTANIIEQHSKIISGGSIEVVATGDVTMFTTAEMESLNEDITLTGNNLQLASLKSANGTTTTNALGAIKDGNGSATNIIAARWQADAVSGIGSGRGENAGADAIETEINVLWARNTGKLGSVQTESDVNITNVKALTIEQLRNNGDISITNNGDIVLDNTNNADFASSDTDARTQGGVINAGDVAGGQLLLTISNGMVRALNKAVATNPDIIADVAAFNFKTSNDFGERNRKIVMHVPDEYYQNARLSFVHWPKGKPKFMQDFSKVPNESLISGRDQLIQIEGLSEIDPAIFTNLRNYVHDEVAILLPVDQRFEDNEDFQ
ncbi:MAG: hypothetical protein B0W54_20865 [Cellvibrio sp. 79]|nr:MAG: hypothetical protein B0W54_20865 [Cellvibrio sp. 79]